MYRNNKLSKISRVSIAIAGIFCAMILFGCRNNSTVAGANPTNANSPAKSATPAAANSPAMKQQQAVTQGMNQYWLSHAPAAQKSQIQAAISNQQGSQKP